MTETNFQKKLPSQIIFENLKKMVKAKNTAHESMFKFHWKKMWPFRLIWPQVDFERIVRLMEEIRKNCVSQKALVKQALSQALYIEHNFLSAVPPYLDALDVSCKNLAAAAQWKQDWRMKKVNRDVKIKRDISNWSNILKEYETSQGNLTRAGAFVQMGWQDFVSAGGYVDVPDAEDLDNETQIDGVETVKSETADSVTNSSAT